MKTGATGEAGAHYVASELWMRGWIAFCTARNMAGFDVLAVSFGPEVRVNVQVKALKDKGACWFPGSPVLSGPNDFYVFVRRIRVVDINRFKHDPKDPTNPQFDSFEGFLLTGRELKRFVQRTGRFSLSDRAGAAPDKWRQNWQNFRPMWVRHHGRAIRTRKP